MLFQQHQAGSLHSYSLVLSTHRSKKLLTRSIKKLIEVIWLVFIKQIRNNIVYSRRVHKTIFFLPWLWAAVVFGSFNKTWPHHKNQKWAWRKYESQVLTQTLHFILCLGPQCNWENWASVSSLNRNNNFLSYSGAMRIITAWHPLSSFSSEEWWDSPQCCEVLSLGHYLLLLLTDHPSLQRSHTLTALGFTLRSLESVIERAKDIQEVRRKCFMLRAATAFHMTFNRSLLPFV